MGHSASLCPAVLQRPHTYWGQCFQKCRVLLHLMHGRNVPGGLLGALDRARLGRSVLWKRLACCCLMLVCWGCGVQHGSGLVR